MYKYRGYAIILGGFGWAVYAPNGERLAAFDTDFAAERFVDKIIKED